MKVKRCYLETIKTIIVQFKGHNSRMKKISNLNIKQAVFC